MNSLDSNGKRRVFTRQIIKSSVARREKSSQLWSFPFEVSFELIINRNRSSSRPWSSFQKPESLWKSFLRIRSACFPNNGFSNWHFLQSTYQAYFDENGRLGWARRERRRMMMMLSESRPTRVVTTFIRARIFFSLHGRLYTGLRDACRARHGSC